MYLRQHNLSSTNHISDMGILGGAIGAGLGAVGSIFGGISASKAMKRVKKNLQEQRKKTKIGITAATMKMQRNEPTHRLS